MSTSVSALVRSIVSGKVLSTTAEARVEEKECATAAKNGTELHSALDHKRSMTLPDMDKTVVNLANFYSHISELLERGITTEMKLECTIGETLINGVIDRLEWGGDIVRVVDIKTHPGAVFPAGKLPFNACRKMHHSHMLQINIYSVMFEKHLTDDDWFSKTFYPANPEDQLHPIIAKEFGYGYETSLGDFFTAAFEKRRAFLSKKKLKIVPEIYHIPQQRMRNAIEMGFDDFTATRNTLAYKKNWIIEAVRNGAERKRALFHPYGGKSHDGKMGPKPKRGPKFERRRD